MANSLKAIAMEGTISIIGAIGGFDVAKQPSIMEAWMNFCTVRGIMIGSRQQFEEMNRAIEASDIKPVVEKVFGFEETKEAYQFVWDQRHFGKVGISIA